MDSDTILESDREKMQSIAQKKAPPKTGAKSKPKSNVKAAVKESTKSNDKKKATDKKKAEAKSTEKLESSAKEDAGVFGGDYDSKADDPYMADEVSKEDLLTLDSFAEEEKKAMAAPLKASEMKKMEQGSDALFKEITAGLKGVSDSEYKKAKRFFQLEEEEE